MAEYNQSIEEGLNLEGQKALFESAAALKSGKIKKRMSDLIYEMLINAKIRSGYKYNEPNNLKEIKAF